MPIVRKRRGRRVREWAPAAAFLVFALVLAATHAPFADLPFHWDELGYYVPAALDLFEKGSLVPVSVPPNVHPPGLSLYLAGIWKLFGFSIVATRLAMLALGAAALAVMFLLGIEYGRDVPGIPAILATVALCASPVFFMQSMMAQPEMPVMLFGLIALLSFFRERYAVSAAACVAAVLFKETAILFPLVLGFVLLKDRRGREAAWFLAPAVVLAAWLGFLYGRTGNALGNVEFARYNASFLAHPLRIAAAMAKRTYSVTFENLHWVGMIGICWATWLTGLFQQRRWRIAAALVILHVVVLSVVGGALLERYLLPIFPLLYLAMIAGWSSCPNPGRTFGVLLLIAGLGISNFWSPPYPAPYENNLAMVDFVRLQARAAEYVESRQPNARIATIWPMSAALRRPEMGYVKFARQVQEIPDFSLSSVRGLKPESTDVVVFFPREWEPHSSLTSIAPLARAWRKLFGFTETIGGGNLEGELGLKVTISYAQGRQWIEVYVADPRSPKRAAPDAFPFP